MFGKRFRAQSSIVSDMRPSNCQANDHLLKQVILPPDPSSHELNQSTKSVYPRPSIPPSPNLSTPDIHAAFDTQHRLLPPFNPSTSTRSSSTTPSNHLDRNLSIRTLLAPKLPSLPPDDPIPPDLGTPTTETFELPEPSSEPRFELEYRLPPTSPLSTLDINLNSSWSGTPSPQQSLRQVTNSIKSDRLRQSLPSLSLVAAMDSATPLLTRSKSSQDFRGPPFTIAPNISQRKRSLSFSQDRTISSSSLSSTRPPSGDIISPTSPHRAPSFHLTGNCTESQSGHNRSGSTSSIPDSSNPYYGPSSEAIRPTFQPQSLQPSTQIQNGVSEKRRRSVHELSRSCQGSRHSLVPFHSGKEASLQGESADWAPQPRSSSSDRSPARPSSPRRRLRSHSQSMSDKFTSDKCRPSTSSFSPSLEIEGSMAQAISRPPSIISRSSTSSIFQRIKAGMSTYKVGAYSSVGSQLDRHFIDPSSSLISVYSHGNDPHQFRSDDHDIYGMGDVENLNSPKLSSSHATNRSMRLSESRNLESIHSLYRSQSDSISQPRAALDVLRSSDSPSRQQPPRHFDLPSSSSAARIEAVFRSPNHPTLAAIPRSDSQKLTKPPRNTRRPKTAGASPAARNSKALAPASAPAIKKTEKLKILERLNDDESEEDYLIRLGRLVEQSKIPSMLASSNQPFHSSALAKYMTSFEFSHDPIDLSIRKLLMVVDLPPETQQIDRVIESFAKRYTECNPKLFNSHDQVYILAFSIIMLHTDAFNKSNKAKMSRADYVKNTKMGGIPTELLEYIYDNVTYTPFVYVDANRDITGQRPITQSSSSNDYTVSSLFALAGHNSLYGSSNPVSGSILPSARESKSKIDPYQLIAKGSTHELRPDLGSFIPSRNPFSFTGSVNWFDFKRLRDSFSTNKLVLLQIVNLFPLKSNSIFKQIESEDSSLILHQSFNHVNPHQLSFSPYSGSPHSQQIPAMKKEKEDESIELNPTTMANLSPNNPLTIESGVLNLRAIKVGLIHMKHDIPSTTMTSILNQASSNQQSHQRSLVNELNLARNVITKKWKSFCVLLTMGQLILIKDVGLIDELKESISRASIRNQTHPEEQLVVRITGLKPDLLFNLDGAIALMDSTYHMRPCTFSFTLSQDLSVLMGVDDNDDMNSWITHINYAAAYKTSKVLPGCFHFNSSCAPSVSGSPNSKSKAVDRGTLVIDDLGSQPQSSNVRSSSESKSKVVFMDDSLPFIRSASTSNIPVAGPSTNVNNRRSSASSHQLPSTPSISPPTCWDLLKSQIGNLESQIESARTTLNEDLRLARNLAVLTPFQLSTRSRLQQAILPVAERVRSSRCLLSKLVCYREILVRDFAASQSLRHTSVKPSPSGLQLPNSDDQNEPAFNRNRVGSYCSFDAAVISRSSLATKPAEPPSSRNSGCVNESDGQGTRMTSHDPSTQYNADRIQQLLVDHRRSTSSCSHNLRVKPAQQSDEHLHWKPKRFSEALLSLGTTSKAKDSLTVSRRCSKDFAGVGIRLTSCTNGSVNDDVKVSLSSSSSELSGKARQVEEINGKDLSVLLPRTTAGESSKKPTSSNYPNDTSSDDETDEIHKTTATLRKVGRLQMDDETLFESDTISRLRSSTIGTTKSLPQRRKSAQESALVGSSSSGTNKSLSKLPKGFSLSTKRASTKYPSAKCPNVQGHPSPDSTHDDSNSMDLGRSSMHSPLSTSKLSSRLANDHSQDEVSNQSSGQIITGILPAVPTRNPTISTTSTTSTTPATTTFATNAAVSPTPSSHARSNNSAKARMLTKSKMASNRNEECRAFKELSPSNQRAFPQLPISPQPQLRSPSFSSQSNRQSSLSLGLHHHRHHDGQNCSEDDRLPKTRPRSSTGSQTSRPNQKVKQTSHPNQPRRFTQAWGLP